MYIVNCGQGGLPLLDLILFLGRCPSEGKTKEAGQVVFS